MKNKTKLILLLLFVAAFVRAQESTSYALLSPGDLNNLISQEKSLLIMDLRSSGDYISDHIPGSINVDRREFDSKVHDYSGMMASKEQIEKVLSELGVLPSSHIVIYDADTELSASRLWFVLKTFGHEKVQLLDGGFNQWKISGMPVTNETIALPPSKYTFPEIVSDYYGTREDVKAGIQSKQVVILDVRSEGEYADGHVPGAVNLEWTNSLSKENIFKTKDDILKQFAEAGITGDKEIITYCRSGVRASHTAYVLRELLGFKNVKIYDGSWTEWTHFKEEVEK